ncbi:hypothetical protein [Tahibacter soli]|uniref:Uncharacterized protein n=1 Tax=Tahibacter soli TaxID=2983605 RepID=A0A9X4BHD4_9GAMM|nr:hypothetical protein [Tahibacter soli]MDC8012268.1 hypothetical protein [Tahibacter soli]
MDARSTIADLLRLGFAVEKKNDLWFVGFPDGADGRVLDVDQFASLNVGELKELADRRRQAIDGIRALLAHAGWGMRVNADGIAELGLGGASSYIDIGLPLTFWLQRSGLVPTLRRFVDGFVRDLDDRTIERVRRVDAQTRSRELYDAHLAQCAAIEANAVELETDPAEQAKRMAEIETYRRDAEREHRAWVDARRVPGSVDEQLRAVLAQSRSDMRAGNGLWLGGLPLWASDADDWTTREEWVEWAEPLLEKWVGNAHVLLRFAPLRHAPAVRAKLLDAQRDQTLEHDESDLELAVHFVDDDTVADWVFAPQPPRNLSSAAATLGLRDGLYTPAQTLKALLQKAPCDLLPWLIDIKDVEIRVGWRFFASMLDADQRALIARACHTALDTPADPLSSAVTVETVLMLALGLGDADIARRVAVEPLWQSALLWRWERGRFLALKDGILAMSLLMPGVE